MRSSPGIENADIVLPSLSDSRFEQHPKNKELPIISPHTGLPRVFGSGFIQKCSKIFKFSPGKNDESNAAMPSVFDERLDVAASEDAAAEANGNLTDDVVSMPEESPAVPAAITEQNEVEESSLPPENDAPALATATAEQNETDGPSLPHENAAAATTEQNEAEEPSLPPENDSPPKQRGGRQYTRRGRGGAKAGVRRTRTMKAVVEDAKAILGENLYREDAKESSQQTEESQGISVHTGDTNNTRQTRQKRRRALASETANSENAAEESESQSQSISIGGGRRKKRQISTASGAQAPVVEKRYNLRHSTVVKNSVAATQATSDQAKAKTRASHQASQDNNEIAKEGNHKLTHTVHKSTNTSVIEVSSQRVVEETDEESNAVKSVEISEMSASETEEDIVRGVVATIAEEPSNGSSSSGDIGDENEMDDDEEKHNASIGKKLWNFFTT